MDGTLKANGLPPSRWYDVLRELGRARDGLHRTRAARYLNNRIFQIAAAPGERKARDGKPLQNDGRGKVLDISGQGRRLRHRMWKVYGSLVEEYVGGLASNHDPVARVLNALVE